MLPGIERGDHVDANVDGERTLDEGDLAPRAAAGRVAREDGHETTGVARVVGDRWRVVVDVARRAGDVDQLADGRRGQPGQQDAPLQQFHGRCDSLRGGETPTPLTRVFR
jgi:hypothetical protein